MIDKTKLIQMLAIAEGLSANIPFSPFSNNLRKIRKLTNTVPKTYKIKTRSKEKELEILNHNKMIEEKKELKKLKRLEKVT